MSIYLITTVFSKEKQYIIQYLQISNLDKYIGNSCTCIITFRSYKYISKMFLLNTALLNKSSKVLFIDFYYQKFKCIAYNFKTYCSSPECWFIYSRSRSQFIINKFKNMTLKVNMHKKADKVVLILCQLNRIYKFL